MSAIGRSSVVGSKSLSLEHSNVTPPEHSDNPDRLALPISDMPAQERSQTASLYQQDVVGDDGVTPSPSAQSEDKSIIEVQKRKSDKTSWLHTAALWAFCL